MTWSLDDPLFALDETAAELLERCRRQVLRTGIAGLDQALDGLHPGELLEVLPGCAVWFQQLRVQLWSKKGSLTTEMLHHVRHPMNPQSGHPYGLQVVARCALPRSAAGVALGGEEREVVFLDTGGKLEVEHLKDILRQMIRRAVEGMWLF